MYTFTMYIHKKVKDDKNQVSISDFSFEIYIFSHIINVKNLLNNIEIHKFDGNSSVTLR